MTQRETPEGKWTLEGWDTFSRENYSLPGTYDSESDAMIAAVHRFIELERDQPTSTSGGQNGIQDQVFIVSPDGKKQRLLKH